MLLPIPKVPKPQERSPVQINDSTEIGNQERSKSLFDAHLVLSRGMSSPAYGMPCPILILTMGLSANAASKALV